MCIYVSMKELYNSRCCQINVELSKFYQLRKNLYLLVHEQLLPTPWDCQDFHLVYSVLQQLLQWMVPTFKINIYITLYNSVIHKWQKENCSMMSIFFFNSRQFIYTDWLFMFSSLSWCDELVHFSISIYFKAGAVIFRC